MFEEEKLTEEQREEMARERARRGLAALRRALEEGAKEPCPDNFFTSDTFLEIILAIVITIGGIVAFSLAACWAAGVSFLVMLLAAPDKADIAARLVFWLAWVPAAYSLSGMFSLDRERPSAALTVAAFVVSITASAAIAGGYILPWTISLLN